MWGTDMSGLTPGSRPDGRNRLEPNGSGSRTEKRFQTVPSIFALLRHLGPHVGYRWVWLDPRITPRWTQGIGTERFQLQNRKTGFVALLLPNQGTYKVGVYDSGSDTGSDTGSDNTGSRPAWRLVKRSKLT